MLLISINRWRPLQWVGDANGPERSTDIHKDIGGCLVHEDATCGAMQNLVRSYLVEELDQETVTLSSCHCERWCGESSVHDSTLFHKRLN